MFASLILYHVLVVTEPYIDIIIAEILRVIIGSVLAIGLSGVAANTLQLGVDQLTDASSSDLSSYISWYIWNYSLTNLIIPVLQSCSCGIDDTKIKFYIFPLLCMFSVVSDILLNL